MYDRLSGESISGKLGSLWSGFTKYFAETRGLFSKYFWSRRDQTRKRTPLRGKHPHTLQIERVEERKLLAAVLTGQCEGGEVVGAVGQASRRRGTPGIGPDVQLLACGFRGAIRGPGRRL